MEVTPETRDERARFAEFRDSVYGRDGPSSAAGPSAAGPSSASAGHSSAAAVGSSMQAGPWAAARSACERPSKSAGSSSPAISRASLVPVVRDLFDARTPWPARDAPALLGAWKARHGMDPTPRGPIRPSPAAGSQRAANTPSATAQTTPSPAARSQREAQTPAPTAPSASASASRASPPSNATTAPSASARASRAITPSVSVSDFYAKTTTRAARPQLVVGKLPTNSNKFKCIAVLNIQFVITYQSLNNCKFAESYKSLDNSFCTIRLLAIR